MSGQDSGDPPVTGPAPRRRAGRLRGTGRISKTGWSAAAALLAVIVIVSETSGSSGPQSHPPPPAAQAFTLKALGHPDQRVSLPAFAGQPVIINFFASWCGPCKRETPLLARFYRDSGGRTVVIGVDANDQAGAAERFVHAAGVTYPVGFDPFPAATTTSYGVLALPQTFFLNAKHRIVKRILGDVTMKELTAGIALMDGKGGALAGATGPGTDRNQDRG
jgi:cytochrome c biogenesis protein CcmG, thiol:disulfide interchange protein DsbE